MPMLLLILAGSVGASDQQKAAEDLIRVSADRMEADEKNRTVMFYGQVVAQQSGMAIYSEKMTLAYRPGEAREIEKIEIDGGLRIVQGDRVATADHGIYKFTDGLIVLYGSAEVHQSGNSIVGDEIIYYLNEARSVVKSRPDSRVNAVFSPGGKP